MNRKDRRDRKELTSKLKFFQQELKSHTPPKVDLEGDMETRQAQIRQWTVRRANLIKKIYELEGTIGNVR